MAATLAQMRNRIANNADRDITTVRGTVTEGDLIDQAIVAAIKFYEKRATFWFLETNTTSLILATDERSIILPSDFNKLIRFRVKVNNRWLTDGSGLELKTAAELKSIDTDDNVSGQPSLYAIYGDDLKVYPKAADMYSTDLDYYKKDTAYPSSDGDTSVLMGDNSEDLIFYEGLARFWGDSLQDDEKRAIYSTLANNEYTNLIRANNSQQYYYRTS